MEYVAHNIDPTINICMQSRFIRPYTPNLKMLGQNWRQGDAHGLGQAWGTDWSGDAAHAMHEAVDQGQHWAEPASRDLRTSSEHAEDGTGSAIGPGEDEGREVGATEGENPAITAASAGFASTLRDSFQPMLASRGCLHARWHRGAMVRCLDHSEDLPPEADASDAESVDCAKCITVEPRNVSEEAACIDDVEAWAGRHEMRSGSHACPLLLPAGPADRSMLVPPAEAARG